MCHKFRNLKEISVKVDTPMDITNDFPREPTEDEDKFLMLTKIKVEFCVHIAYYEERAMKNYQNYLIAKCPKVEKPIQMEISVWSVWSFKRKCKFESK